MRSGLFISKNISSLHCIRNAFNHSDIYAKTSLGMSKGSFVFSQLCAIFHGIGVSEVAGIELKSYGNRNYAFFLSELCPQSLIPDWKIVHVGVTTSVYGLPGDKGRTALSANFRVSSLYEDYRNVLKNGQSERCRPKSRASLCKCQPYWKGDHQGQRKKHRKARTTRRVPLPYRYICT